MPLEGPEYGGDELVVPEILSQDDVAAALAVHCLAPSSARLAVVNVSAQGARHDICNTVH